MLDLLCELVPRLLAYDRAKLFKLVLKPDVLIVMANHSAVEVRIAVIQVQTIRHRDTYVDGHTVAYQCCRYVASTQLTMAWWCKDKISDFAVKRSWV